MPEEKDKRIEHLIKLLVNYTCLDFSEKAIISEKGDEIDALAKGLNYMAEELKISFKKEREQATEIKKLNELLKQQIEKKTGDLAKSEGLFRATIENGSDVIMLRSSEGKILYLSPSITSVLGYTQEECLNKPPYQFDHPDEAEILKDWRVQVISSPGKSFYIQLRLLHKNGSYRWCEGTSNNLLHDPNIKAIVTNFRDISERKNLEEQQAILVSIINSTDDAILSKTLDGTITSWNKGAENIFGFRSSEIIGKNISMLIPPHLLNEEKEIIEKISKGYFVNHYETERVRKDGEIINVSLTISPIRDSFGKIIGASKICRDTTERKKIETKLVSSEKQLRHTLDNMLEGVQIHDFDWKYTYVNDSLVKSNKYLKEELLGYTLMEKYPGIEQTHLFKALERSMKERIAQQLETEFIFPDGTKADFELSIQPVPEGLFVLSIDISERKKAEAKILAALKETTDYKDALDEACIVAITDEKGKINYVNDNFCSISEYSREELIGQDHKVINSGHHSKEFIKSIWATITKGKIWKGEIKNKAKNGTYYWVDTTIVPFLDEKGKPFQYVAIRSDITERKNSEEQLIKTLKRLSQAQEIANLGSWELNFASGIVTWSTENCLIHGLLPIEDKQTFNAWLSFIHPEDLPKVKKDLEKLYASKTEISFEHRIICKYGNVKHINSIAKFDFDEEGNELGLHGVCHDITEGKISEIKIKESETKLKDAQAIAHVGSWEIDLVNNLLYWSDEQYRLLGFNKGEIIASNDLFLSMVHPDDSEKVNKNFINVFQIFESSSYNFRIILRDGTVKHVFCEWKFEFDSNNKPLRIYGIVQDITEKKLAEEQIIQSEIQIRKFANHLWNIQEEERTHLAREIHDELGQELVGIKIGLSSFAKANLTPNETISCVKDMVATVDNTIQSLRKIATELRPGILDTLGLVPSIEWLGKEFERKKNIKCKLELNILEQRFDKEISICFFRICQESLTNISKHAEASEVKIRLFKDDNQLTMEIIDNGTGISNEKLKNPFSMGLLGMKERASNIGGTLIITSNKEIGTTIQLKALIK